MTTPQAAPRTVAYIGNFRPEHSTENHVARALRTNGHTVVQLQENEPRTWDRLVAGLASQADAQVLLWTRTGWDPPVPHDTQRQAIESAKARGAVVVGYHLDRWWGLDREHQVHDEPFFQLCDLMCTADGGHGHQWDEAGVRHHWMPPAVSAAECVPIGRRLRSYTSPVAFVGSWQHGYHPEWRHRPELVAWLRQTYGNRVRFWPPRRGMAVRGQALRDLYASADVLVGDSCLVGDKYTDGQLVGRYWSDRVPETLGRGGYLVHPHVQGLTSQFLQPINQPADADSVYVGPATWPVGDWDELHRQIEWALANPAERAELAAHARAHVLQFHTYEARMAHLLGTVLPEAGLL